MPPLLSLMQPTISQRCFQVRHLPKLKETAKEPEAKPALTLEEVRSVLADKSRAGHTAEVRELLKKYGAAKLSEVDAKHYEALLRDAEVL